jgi:hypothetical protein
MLRVEGRCDVGMSVCVERVAEMSEGCFIALVAGWFAASQPGSISTRQSMSSSTQSSRFKRRCDVALLVVG